MGLCWAFGGILLAEFMAFLTIWMSGFSLLQGKSTGSSAELAGAAAFSGACFVEAGHFIDMWVIFINSVPRAWPGGGRGGISWLCAGPKVPRGPPGGRPSGPPRNPWFGKKKIKRRAARSPARVPGGAAWGPGGGPKIRARPAVWGQAQPNVPQTKRFFLCQPPVPEINGLFLLA